MTRFRNIQSLEESEHRLLMEVDHRAKNVLAVVESVVRLTRSDDAARYSASVQNRVQALSRAHVLLADNGWQDIELRDAIRVQLEPIGSRRMRLNGPRIMVPATIVQPLGLVFHELAVNAAVHGSLSSPQGQLEITWRDRPDGGIALVWHDVAEPDRRERHAVSDLLFSMPWSRSSSAGMLSGNGQATE